MRSFARVFSYVSYVICREPSGQRVGREPRSRAGKRGMYPLVYNRWIPQLFYPSRRNVLYLSVKQQIQFKFCVQLVIK